ncbi:response regulator transcription factor [Paucibacter sp. APW11]|uniref:Response regulator transcription factor n=1 Tax=Roseateles aquae TaxID=3077235 RepID=A0ABU3P6J5_9BURK|nr:response regulator transcription factor [Paucibacter sp. APW11]MDT8998193.1 response regulator transcription factor [Paucibacter sp. APW11]
MSIQVIVADDHHIVREGLVALLEREHDIEVQAQARDGMELVRLAREHDPDVVLVDVAMPCMNGIEAMRRLRAEPMRCKMICLSVHAEPQQVAAALDAGASGYVLKENSFDELARGVRRVMANQLFLSGELVGEMLLGRLQSRSHGGSPDGSGPGRASATGSALTRLTPREREMVQLFSEGYTAQEIATQLHLSAKTVATHREHVFAKLQIQGIAELTRFALREGLSSLDVSRPRA